MIELDPELARPYAQALVGAVQSQGGDPDAVIAELAEIYRDLFEAFPRFHAVMGSGEVPAADRDRILLELLDGRASEVVLRFLRVLSRRGRIEFLHPVIREAQVIWDRECNRVPVTVETATALADSQLALLKERLAAALGKTPLLTVTVRPELIGGFVIQVGDNRFDASLKNRLEHLRNRLIEGRTYEIQSRRDQFSYSA